MSELRAARERERQPASEDSPREEQLVVAPVDSGDGDSEQLRQDVARLTEQLQAVQAAADDKDAEIVELQTMLAEERERARKGQNLNQVWRAAGSSGADSACDSCPPPARHCYCRRCRRYCC